MYNFYKNKNQTKNENRWYMLEKIFKGYITNGIQFSKIIFTIIFRNIQSLLIVCVYKHTHKYVFIFLFTNENKSFSEHA